MSTNGCKTAAVSCKETLYTYNMFHVVKAFFPEAEIRQTVNEEQEPLVNLVLDGGSCFSVMPDLSVRTGAPVMAEELPELEEDAGEQDMPCRAEGLREQAQGSADHAALRLTGGDRNERKKQVTRRIYDCLAAYTGKQLAWGTLTGVRPVKLAMNRLKAGDGEEEITAFLQRPGSRSGRRYCWTGWIIRTDSACISVSRFVPVSAPTVRSAPRPSGCGRIGWRTIWKLCSGRFVPSGI